MNEKFVFQKRFYLVGGTPFQFRASYRKALHELLIIISKGIPELYHKS